MQHTTTGFMLQTSPSRLWLALVLLVLLALVPALQATVPVALAALPFMGWQALSADGWLPGFRAGRVRGVQVSAAGDCQVLLDGHWRPALVRNDSVAFPWLIVLNLVVDGRRRSLTLFSDSAPGAQQRQLRVFLRWPIRPATE